MVPQTRQTPCPWGLLPSLPGLRERRPFLLPPPPQEPRQRLTVETTLPEPRGATARPQGAEARTRRPSSPVPDHTPTHRRRHTQPHTKPRRGEAGSGDTRQPANRARAHKDRPRTGARPRPRGQRAPHHHPGPQPGQARLGQARLSPASPRGLLPSCSNTAAASLLRAGGPGEA